MDLGDLTTCYVEPPVPNSTGRDEVPWPEEGAAVINGRGQIVGRVGPVVRHSDGVDDFAVTFAITPPG